MLTVALDPALGEIAGDGAYRFVTVDRVLDFGRSLGCAIRFPASDTRFGRKHFSLRPAAGGLELVTDREHPVYIDGERVVGNVALLAETELRLIDSKTGPWIRLSIAQEADGSLTDPNFKIDSGTLQGGMKNLRRAAVAAALAICVVAAGLFYQSHQQEQLRQAYLSETAALAEKLQSPAPNTANWAEVYALIAPSVYAVAVLSNDGSAPSVQGTAWVLGPHELATNAHVANLFSSLQSNQKLVVLAPNQLQSPIPVLASKIHPAYLAFRQTMADVESRGGKDIKTQGSYDVGVLTVAADIGLASPLPVAEAATLQDLKPGEPIAYVGYPAKFAINANAQQLRVGYVSGATDFTGVATHHSGELIYHTAEAVGGASGSPIVNAKGQVVALNSGGEFRQVGTEVINSGAGTFYAQSAALLADVGDGWTVERMKIEAGTWQNAMLYLSRRNEVWAMLQTYRQGDSFDALASPPLFEKQDQIASNAKSTAAQADVSWAKVPPGTYMAFALAQGGIQTGLTLRLRNGAEALQSPLYVDAAPTALFRVEQESDVSFTIGGKAGQDYWLQVLKLAEKK